MRNNMHDRDKLPPYFAFKGKKLIAQGSLEDVSLACQAGAQAELVHVYETESGRVVDIDWRGDSNTLSAWLTEHHSDKLTTAQPARQKRGRGRPKLGVVSREVTLLPRHWQWLASQQGGASVTLRRLIEQARTDKSSLRRQQQDAIYRFITAVAGDEPGFEETMRALYADNAEAFRQHSAKWSVDIRKQAQRMAAQFWSAANG